MLILFSYRLSEVVANERGKIDPQVGVGPSTQTQTQILGPAFSQDDVQVDAKLQIFPYRRKDLQIGTQAH